MDDLSYFNHYVSTELDIDVCNQTMVELALHYERNSFTSTLGGDECQGAHEEVWQEDVEVHYRLTEKGFLNVGVQQSQRKASFEPSTVIDMNAWVGGSYHF